MVERDQLASLVRAAFGPKRRLSGVERLRGGTKKGAYRLAFSDESTAILYVWDASESYWPASHGDEARDRADPFSDASGINLFEASQRRLEALGVRTPRMYFADRSKSHYPADVALVEDLRGGTLEKLLQRDPLGAQRPLRILRSALDTMHRQHEPSFGKVALVDSGEAEQDRPCEQIVLDRALDDLRRAAARVERIAESRRQLEEAMRELAGAIRPRAEYGLIHGELGPDHVLLDEGGRPVIIDIEGVMFFDVEWEHVFLQLRFGEHYRWLRATNLDSRRLQLYRLAMHLSLVAGPLRLLDGDFPEREWIMGIVESNIEATLSFLRALSDRSDQVG